MKPLPPGSAIGILGGGQLGRMLALAAAELGFKVHVLTPEADSPASHVAWRTTIAAYEDESALKAFAASVAAITYEFENVPAETARILDMVRPVRPNPKALAIAQDRLSEKEFLRAAGLATAPFARADDPDEAEKAFAALGGGPAILKTRRFGYDGKGQQKVTSASEAEQASLRFGVPCILEGFVGFEREASIVAARGEDGAIEAYDLVENEHKDHILVRTLAPARVAPSLAEEAKCMAGTILAGLDYVGVAGIEMFVTRDRGLVVNEIAPRVHNSGHWTTDACETSQFEQHIRAVAAWPLRPATRHADAIMHNLVGGTPEEWLALGAEPDVNLHLYGKAESRPGRKMGHATRLYVPGKRP